MKQKIKIRAVLFIEDLDKKFHRISKDEATTFSRITRYLSDQMLAGMPLSVFDEAMTWADEATSIGARNPKAVFVAKVKEKTGYTGRGMVLSDAKVH